ncbi:MAG TPA: hypothetical protein PKE47_02590 [Verrucomicrobiota bacterium]|nr:hypothetical protein [Verrucomicrobiota bacterium]HMO94914.1 hypothetical protein [Tepidiformaceae bacterium]
MYVIRAVGEHLAVTFSEQVTTDECLRATSQAFALADAGLIRRATVELGAVTSGPSSSMVVAAALASRMRPELRVAFVCGAAQRPYIRRIAKFSGIREGLGLFETVEHAEAWLASTGSARRLSSTELRHLRELARERGAEQGAKSKGESRRGAA